MEHSMTPGLDSVRRRFRGLDREAVAALLAEERRRVADEVAELRGRLAVVEAERDDLQRREEERERELTGVLRVATEVAAATTSRAAQEAESVVGEAKQAAAGLRSDAGALHGQLAQFAVEVQGVLTRWGPVLEGQSEPAPEQAPAAPASGPPPEEYSMQLIASPIVNPEQAVELEKLLLGLPEVRAARLEQLEGPEALFSLTVVDDLTASVELRQVGRALRSGLDRYVLVLDPLGEDQASR